MLEADRDGVITGELGPALLNRSGRPVYVLRPEASEFLIEDIAYHLARVRRFSGVGLSVAQHSLLVEGRCAMLGGTRAMRLHALLHDAGEFVLGDMPAPVKMALDMIGGEARAFAELERRHLAAILAALGVPAINATQRALIHSYDIEVRAAEIRDLFPASAQKAFGRMPRPWPDMPIENRLSEEDAERLYLRRYHKILAAPAP